MNGSSVAEVRSAERPSLSMLGGYFLRLGTFGFGGPIALAAHMQRDLVDARQWLTPDEYLEALALAQLAPGPLAAQLAMYIGYLLHGVLGATVIAITFVGPSFVMVLGLSAAYVRFGGLSWMQAVFYGVGAAVIGIISRSSLKLVKSTLKRDALLWGIAATLAISTAVTEREIIWLFLAGGVVSLAVKTSWRPKPQVAMALLPTALLHHPAVNRFATIFGFFAKAGVFVFGSGLAIVPFLHGGVVLEHHWLTETQFVDAVAVAMITPGPVVITVAFIGFLVGGTWGAVAAALGVFLPVYLIVVCCAPFYRRYSSNPHLRAFVLGVTAAAVGAIMGAVVVLARRSVHDIPTLLIAVVTFAVLLKFKVPEPIVIVAAALIGVGVRMVS
jgi:chromate transporter